LNEESVYCKQLWEVQGGAAKLHELVSQWPPLDQGSRILQIP